MIIHKTADNDCTMVKQSINSDSTLIKAQWSLVIMMVGLHFLNKQCVAQMDCGRVFIDLCFNLEEITFNLTFTMFTRHFNASRMIPVKFTRIKKKSIIWQDPGCGLALLLDPLWVLCIDFPTWLQRSTVLSNHACHSGCHAVF